MKILYLKFCKCSGLSGLENFLLPQLSLTRTFFRAFSMADKGNSEMTERKGKLEGEKKLRGKKNKQTWSHTSFYHFRWKVARIVDKTQYNVVL